MSGAQEVLNKVSQKYNDLKQQNPLEQDGKVVWSTAKKLVQTELLADWLMFKQNLGI